MPNAQHNMEIVNGVGLCQVPSDNGAAATIIKYSYNSLSNAYKPPLSRDLLGELARNTKVYHSHQPNLESNDIVTINGNRKAAFESAVALEREMDQYGQPLPLMKNTYLQLPVFGSSEEQLATRGKEWQGESYNVRVEDNDWGLKKQFHTLVSEHSVGGHEFNAPSYYLTWEFPCFLPSGKLGADRELTPVKKSADEELAYDILTKLNVRRKFSG